MIRSTLSAFTKQTMGRVRRRTPRSSKNCFHQPRLPAHIAPETFFHFRQKMLKMLRDLDYLRHRV
jgi:hypothetical protein